MGKILPCKIVADIISFSAVFERYGAGLSEQRLGKALATAQRRSSVVEGQDHQDFVWDNFWSEVFGSSMDWFNVDHH